MWPEYKMGMWKLTCQERHELFKCFKEFFLMCVSSCDVFIITCLAETFIATGFLIANPWNEMIHLTEICIDDIFDV